MSPTTTASTGLMLVLRLDARTSARTLWPASRNTCPMAEPTNPLAPVISVTSPRASTSKHPQKPDHTADDAKLPQCVRQDQANRTMRGRRPRPSSWAYVIETLRWVRGTARCGICFARSPTCWCGSLFPVLKLVTSPCRLHPRHPEAGSSPSVPTSGPLLDTWDRTTSWSYRYLISTCVVRGRRRRSTRPTTAPASLFTTTGCSPRDRSPPCSFH